MSEKPRICFLDIDGPIISTGCYGVTPSASNLRACMNQSAIGYLNMLCNHAKAKIVTNTSHNYHEVKEPDFATGEYRNLKMDLIRWGVKDGAIFMRNGARTIPGMPNMIIWGRVQPNKSV